MEKFIIEGGEVRITKAGLMTVIEAETECTRPGIVRLGALCGDAVRPVGVLVPEQGRLFLRRKLTRSDCELMGLTGITGFTLIQEGETRIEKETRTDPQARYAEEAQRVTNTQTEPENQKKDPPPEKRADWFAPRDGFDWVETAEPGKLFRDSELSRAARGVHGALTAVSGEAQLLAIPMDSERAFPPLPVFRYGEPAVIRGRGYVVFRLIDGMLVG